MTTSEALAAAIKAVGSQGALAEKIGKSQQAISYWVSSGKGVPAEHVLAVEAASGVSRNNLRPDIFGPAPVEAAE